MLDKRLLGPVLLVVGSSGLLMPELLADWFVMEGAGLIGLALVAAGTGLALANWRADLADAPFQGYAALRQIARVKRPVGPAKRMKIRIRCAR